MRASRALRVVVPFALVALGTGVPSAVRAGDPPPVSAPAPVPDARPFLDASGVSLAGVARDGRRIFVWKRVKGARQLHVADDEGRGMRQLTFDRRGPGFAVPSPDGSKVILGIDRGGDENTQLALLDADATDVVPVALTDAPKVQHGRVVWTPDSASIVYRANDAAPDRYRISRMSIPGGAARPLFEPSGTWRVEDVSTDGERLLVVRERSNRDAALFLFHVGTRALTELHPNVDGPAAAAGEARFAGDRGSKVCFVQEHPGQGRDVRPGAWLYDAATGAVETAPIVGDGTCHGCTVWPADVEAIAPLPDGRRVAVLKADPDVPDRIALVELASGEEAATIRVPGELSGLHADALGRLWTSRSGPDDPGSVLRIDPAPTAANRDGIVVRVVGPELGSLAPTSLPDAPKRVEVRASDGTIVPAWLWLPKGRAPKGLPFLLSLHGGPEGEDRPGWHADRAYLLSLGFGVLAPNVRGSSGHGRAFRDADDGAKRPASVADAKACADWLVAQGTADPKRLGVMGGSYGGYMVLALLTTYPDAFAAGAEAVGIANLETFLEHTAPYRRALREAEYGALSDRALLRELSPIHRIDRIRAPLLVAHGANDPRVPVGEAHQLVAALTKLGRPVEALIFEDEGHGFRRPENRRRHVETLAAFFLRHLGSG